MICSLKSCYSDNYDVVLRSTRRLAVWGVNTNTDRYPAFAISQQVNRKMMSHAWSATSTALSHARGIGHIWEGQGLFFFSASRYALESYTSDDSKNEISVISACVCRSIGGSRSFFLSPFHRSMGSDVPIEIPTLFLVFLRTLSFVSHLRTRSIDNGYILQHDSLWELQHYYYSSVPWHGIWEQLSPALMDVDHCLIGCFPLLGFEQEGECYD